MQAIAGTHVNKKGDFSLMTTPRTVRNTGGNRVWMHKVNCCLFSDLGLNQLCSFRLSGSSQTRHRCEFTKQIALSKS